MIPRRRLVNAISVLSIAAWLLALTVQGIDAQSAAKKITGSGQVIAVLSETKMMPGDDLSHVITFLRRLDTDKSDQFGTGQASLVDFSDYVAGSGPHRGYRTVIFPSGDQAFAAYEGMTKGVVKPAGPEGTFQGKWRYVGGTGKFKGITGGGTYTGEFTPTSLTYQYQGDYEIKQ
jgi:hypothetical protein